MEGIITGNHIPETMGFNVKVGRLKMRPTPDERKALESVKKFVEKQFPKSIVVLHASVFWDDNIFTQLAETEAQKLGIENKKCVRGELTPDYTVFSLSDVVCVYHKTPKGRPDRRIEKDTPEFFAIADYDKHIPYIAIDKPGYKVPSGKVTVIAVKPGTRAIAVLDHKGGTKDFNNPSSRNRAIIQGKRFSTNTVFMVVNKEASVNESDAKPKATFAGSSGQHKFYRLK
jgi:hypothetical protein